MKSTLSLILCSYFYILKGYMAMEHLLVHSDTVPEHINYSKTSVFIKLICSSERMTPFI